MIDVSGSSRINAPLLDVWNRIFNPDTLVHIIPGCQHLEKVSEDEYQGRVEIDLAAVKGVYDTHLRVTRHEDNFQCDLVGEVAGPTGTIKGDGCFKLKEVQQDTDIIYEAKALVTGALAKIHPMFIEGVFNILIHRGITRLNQQYGSLDSNCTQDEEIALKNLSPEE
jgi:carbon monoxide dehydrogenase subunit G